MRPTATCLLIFATLLAGCATYRPAYLTQDAVSESRPALAIDGVWENCAGVRVHVCEGNIVHQCGLHAARGSVIIQDLHDTAPGVYVGTATIYNSQRKITAQGVATLTQPYRNGLFVRVNHSEADPMVCDTSGEFFLIEALDANRLIHAYEEGAK